jgi:hypothetical protein
MTSGDGGHASEPAAAGTRPAGARLSTDEALAIARQTALDRGLNLDDFHPPEAHYELLQHDRMWFVSFDGRIAKPGNHFGVLIDDRTGEAKLQGGA